MIKIKKKILKPHLVLVDTSILHHSEKKFVVHPDFDKFWGEYNRKYKFELCIPEVVKGELLFQQATSAINAKKKIGGLMVKISSITEKKHTYRTTNEKIKEQVNARFERWLRTKKGKLIKVPTKKINWRDVITNAIWRLPPFEFTEKDKDKDREKGFRDSLILESVNEYCKQLKNDVHVAFLCKDKLLRETASSRLSHYEFFSVHENIEDFKSYLRLTEEELEYQFLKSIHRLASSKFFTEGDSTSLLIKENLPQKLQDDYKSYFDNPAISEKPQLGSFFVGSTVFSDWKVTQSGTFWVGRSLFKERKNENIYYWETTVTYIKFYEKETMGPIKFAEMSLPLTKQEKRILILPFIINWKAKVTTHAHFHDVSIEKIGIKDNEFREPDKEEINKYDLTEKSKYT